MSGTKYGAISITSSSLHAFIVMIAITQSGSCLADKKCMIGGNMTSANQEDDHDRQHHLHIDSDCSKPASVANHYHKMDANGQIHFRARSRWCNTTHFDSIDINDARSGAACVTRALKRWSSASNFAATRSPSTTQAKLNNGDEISSATTLIWNFDLANLWNNSQMSVSATCCALYDVIECVRAEACFVCNDSIAERWIAQSLVRFAHRWNRTLCEYMPLYPIGSRSSLMHLAHDHQEAYLNADAPLSVCTLIGANLRRLPYSSHCTDQSSFRILDNLATCGLLIGGILAGFILMITGTLWCVEFCCARDTCFLGSRAEARRRRRRRAQPRSGSPSFTINHAIKHCRAINTTKQQQQQRLAMSCAKVGASVDNNTGSSSKRAPPKRSQKSKLQKFKFRNQKILLKSSSRNSSSNSIHPHRRKVGSKSDTNVLGKVKTTQSKEDSMIEAKRCNSITALNRKIKSTIESVSIKSTPTMKNVHKVGHENLYCSQTKIASAKRSNTKRNVVWCERSNGHIKSRNKSQISSHIISQVKTKSEL